MKKDVSRTKNLKVEGKPLPSDVLMIHVFTGNIRDY